MLSLALLALVPHSEPRCSLQDLFEFGQLRHVQLLQPRGEVVRFATQIEMGTIEDHWPKGVDTSIAIFEGESGQPVAELSVGNSLIRGFTWIERPAWFLVEAGATTVLAVLQLKCPGVGRAVGSGLRLCSFPRGDELLSIPGVQEIEDGLVRVGRADLLVRHGGSLLWLRLSEASEVVVSTIDLGLDAVACAAFARGGSGDDLAAWAIGWKGKELLAVPFEERGGEMQRAFRLSFDDGSSNDALVIGDRLRSTIWVGQSTACLALGWPGYDHGVGKLQVVDISAEPRVLWEGRPYPEMDGDSLDQREYGQALAFVPDANEDGVPEILVTGPWKAIHPSIDLLSGLTGGLLKSWSPGVFACTGHSLSLSEDSRRVLVGGTEHQGYPENLAAEGQAHLLDVVSMERLQTWKLSSHQR